MFVLTKLMQYLSKNDCPVNHLLSQALSTVPSKNFNNRWNKNFYNNEQFTLWKVSGFPGANTTDAFLSITFATTGQTALTRKS